MSYETTSATPSSVVWSSRLYIVGAIIGLIGAAVAFLALPASIAAGTEAANRSATNGVDMSGAVSGIVVGGVVFNAVVSIVFSILMIVFARKMLTGLNWARVVLAVLAGLQIFGILGAYGVGAIHFIAVLVALILSFLPASNAWFQQQKAARTTAAPVV